MRDVVGMEKNSTDKVIRLFLCQALSDHIGIYLPQPRYRLDYTYYNIKLHQVIRTATSSHMC